jgi:CRP/FNR family cyclic AMP-dependent transcriptional regulator
MDQKLYQKILTMVPLFRTLSPTELQEIIAISKLLRVRQGVTVVEEGDVGGAMYILVEGRVEVRKNLPGGEKTPLAPLAAPTVFGEMALIDRSPRSASVVTLTDAVLYQINLQAFNQLREALHPAAFKVLREVAPTMCQRLRQLNDRVGEFFMNPNQNLASIEEEYLGKVAGNGPLPEGEH